MFSNLEKYKKEINELIKQSERLLHKLLQKI